MADPTNDLDPLPDWSDPNSIFAMRSSGLFYRPYEINYHRRSDNILNRRYISPDWGAVGSNLDPRPDLASRIEDQRGLTPAELDLQARFQKSRSMGAWAPGSSLDPDPEQARGPMAKALGVDNIKEAADRIALRHAGEILAQHTPSVPENTGVPEHRKVPLPRPRPKQALKESK